MYYESLMFKHPSLFIKQVMLCLCSRLKIPWISRSTLFIQAKKATRAEISNNQSYSESQVDNTSVMKISAALV